MSQTNRPTTYSISYEDIQAHAEPDERPAAPATVTIGAFTMTGGVVSGPAAYMAERGRERLRRIEAGQDMLVTYSLGRGLSPNAETAVLVSLQTDYAAWLGEQEMLARSEAARASQREFMARMQAQRDAARRGRRRP